MNDAKTALGQKILAIKQAKGLTWAALGAQLGHAPVWTCAACLGQMSMTAETAAKAAACCACSAPKVSTASSLTRC